MLLYEILTNAKQNNSKLIFVLIDPDKFNESNFDHLILKNTNNNIDAFLVGGSLITEGSIKKTIDYIKSKTNLPVCIFPGNFNQIVTSADSILFLSLISGRNPEFLIGNQVLAAPLLCKSKMEVIPTGYILVDGGKTTTVHYMSNTTPIPSDKPEIALATALAGQLLGLKCLYFDCGSGALNPVSGKFLNVIYKNVDIPIIVGGGIKNKEKACELFENGATAIVIGNAAEKNPDFIFEINKQ